MTRAPQVDAILGALTMPDIGQLFPDNDPRLFHCNSEIFMEEAYSRMVDRGYRIGNVDVTLICEKPRVNVCIPLPDLPSYRDPVNAAAVFTPLRATSHEPRAHAPPCAGRARRA